MAQLKINLVVDDKGKVTLQGFKGEVQSIDKHLATLSNTANVVKNALYGAFGAFSVYQVMNFGKECLRTADAVGKTADAIDISTRALQEYQYVARLSGVDTELLNRSFESFTKRLGELRAGTGDLEYKLKDMNVQLMEQLKGAGNTTQALDLLFKAMDKTTNSADKAALAAAAFGRGGVKMVNMLREGYEGMERLREKANALGIVLSEDVIRNAEKVNDEFDTMKTIMKTQLTGAFVEMAPAILKVSEGLASIASAIGSITQQLKQLDAEQNIIRLLYGLAGAGLGGLAGGAIGGLPGLVIGQGIGGGLGLSLGGILAPGNISGEEEAFLKSAWNEVLGGKKGGTPPAPTPEKVYMDIYANKWNKLSQDMAKTFSNALIKGFGDFAETARQIFARDFVDRILQGPINKLSESIFGPSGFLTKTTLPGGAVLGDVLGAGALGYGLGGIGGGVGAAGGYALGSTLGSAGGPLGMLIGGALGGAITSFFESDESIAESIKRQYDEAFDSMMVDLRATISEAVGGGFLDAVKSQDYNAFLNSIDNMIYDLVGGIFTKLASSQAVEPLAALFDPALKQIQNMEFFESDTFTQAIREEQKKWFSLFIKGGTLQGTPYGSIEQKYLENPNISAQDFYNMFFPIAKQQTYLKYGGGGTMADVIGAFPAGEAIDEWGQEFKPLIEELMGTYKEVMEALGLNTEAIESNTDALIGPVEAFLRDLSVGPLAPVQSMEGLQNAYNEVLAQAAVNPQAFSTFAGFARSDYIPFAKSYGGDYGSIVESIKQDVTSLPWYQQAKTEVNVKVYLDSQELKASINTLVKSDPDIRDEIRRIHY